MLLTTVGLLLTTPTDIGMMMLAQTYDAQAEVSEVQIDLSELEEDVLFSDEKVLTKEGVSDRYAGGIRISNPDYLETEPCPAASGFCDYGIGVFTDALKDDSELNFKVVTAPTTALSGLVPIGNKTVAELPLETINLENPVPIMFFQSPSFPGAYEDAIGTTFVEIGITLSDGREYTTLRNYKFGDSITIQRGDIRLALQRFDLPPPKTLRISALPVRRQNSDDSDKSSVAKTQEIGTASLKTLLTETSFANRYATGLFVMSSNFLTQALFTEVLLQQNESEEEKPIAQGEAVFDGISPVGIDLPGNVTLSVGSGSLRQPTELRLELCENRPEGRDPKFSAVGPRAVVEVPLDKFNLSNPDTNLLAIWVPVPSETKAEAFNILQEVAITLGDGTEYVYLDQYGDDWAITVTPTILSSIFGKYPEPEILRVSVQPVDTRGWYEEFAPDPIDEDDGGNGSSAFSTLALINEDPKYLEGLYKIPFGTDFATHCNGETETMPDANNSASPPEGKTPLVLVHG